MILNQITFQARIESPAVIQIQDQRLLILQFRIEY